MSIGGSVDELGGDANAIAIANDGAFENEIDVELAGDDGQRLLRAFVDHGGGARDDAEGPDLSDIGDELLGEAVGEIILAGVFGEILEGKDGEGVGSGVSGGAESLPSVDEENGGGGEGEDEEGDDGPAGGGVVGRGGRN